MAQWCCFAVIRINIMNWSAISWYQLYLIVTHHRSDGRVHGVISCRKYSLKIMPWLVRVELCKVRCPLIPTRIPRRGHLLTSKPRLGRPQQSTLEDGRQLLRLVRNGQTKSTSAPREKWHQPTNVPLSQWLINNQPFGLV